MESAPDEQRIDLYAILGVSLSWKALPQFLGRSC